MLMTDTPSAFAGATKIAFAENSFLLNLIAQWQVRADLEAEAGRKLVQLRDPREQGRFEEQEWTPLWEARNSVFDEIMAFECGSAEEVQIKIRFICAHFEERHEGCEFGEELLQAVKSMLLHSPFVTGSFVAQLREVQHELQSEA